MEFSFTAEERAFRERVRGYYRENPPPAGGRGGGNGREYRHGLAEHGWLTMHWPQEYGGQGASALQQVISRKSRSGRESSPSASA